LRGGELDLALLFAREGDRRTSVVVFEQVAKLIEPAESIPRVSTLVAVGLSIIMSMLVTMTMIVGIAGGMFSGSMIMLCAVAAIIVGMTEVAPGHKAKGQQDRCKFQPAH
jgi:hypothetical protein